MITDLVAENSILLISAIAILVSIRSYWLAHKAHNLAQIVNAREQELIIYRQRTEILAEIDKHNILLNRLATIALKKMASGTYDKNSSSYKRLEKNINGYNELRNGYEKKRALAHSIGKEDSPNTNEYNLAELRRFTFYLEQEIENELDEEITN